MAGVAVELKDYWRFPAIRKFLRPNRAAIFDACVIGTTAGVSASIIALGVSFLGSLRLQTTEHYPPTIVLPLIGFVGGCLSGLLVQLAPDAAGSGIPQVKAVLQHVRVTMDIRTAVMKLLGGILALGSGLVMGREGPTVHVGAAIAADLNRLLPTTPERRRQLMAAGAGAGLAAAFNAPIAGVLFVLEELLKNISAQTIGTAILACFVGSVASHFLHGAGSVSHVQEAAGLVQFQLRDIPFLILLGVGAGISGALFNRSVIAMLDFNKNVLKAVPVFLRVGLAGAICGGLISILPQTFFDYAELREMVVKDTIPISSVILVFPVFFFLTVVSYGSGAPGGLFAPSLALGSSLGFLIGLLQSSTTGSATMPMLALTGMGAMFTAVARVPITAIVIVFEMTRNFALVLPLMIACIISNTIANKLYPDSIYDRLMGWAGIKPGPRTRGPGEELNAAAIMRPPVVISPDATLEEAHKHFAESDLEEIVVADQNVFAGTLSAAALMQALASADQTKDRVTIRDLSIRHATTIDPTASIETVLFLFDSEKLKILPVLENKQVSGMIAAPDLIHAIYDEGYCAGSGAEKLLKKQPEDPPPERK